MNKKEAKKVISIMLTADLGCYICSADLCKRFKKEFPKFSKLVEEMYEDKYGMSIREALK